MIRFGWAHWLVTAILLLSQGLHAEDGYRLWLRYDPIADPELREDYTRLLGTIVLSTPGSADSATLRAARTELQEGLKGLLDIEPEIGFWKARGRVPGHPEGYRVEGWLGDGNAGQVVITGGDDTGVLYGAFALLRHLQTRGSMQRLLLESAPDIDRRLLNHWDNLDRTIERVTNGFSLWEWFQLPEYVNPRYRDYARACASVGINGSVLTNVNANALVLTPEYLGKVAAIADVLRPYNIRVYLTARFSAPISIGGLDTADPLDAEVQAWWRAKVDEIYEYIPDFGGFLVKANSEGQPGPQDYGRSHAEGANLLAAALEPHGGIVMWRAFVYSAEVPEDRARQAYNEFKPLDGEFLPNVVIQVKNGPIDFQPREPIHPLFGAMEQTGIGMEFQITQEYLGYSIHLTYLAPLYEEVLDTDTFAAGRGSTVARVIDGTIHGQEVTVMAGVSNIGNVRNWTGHPMASANWYAFGRLAWDPDLPSAGIADEWTRMTFGNDPGVVNAIVSILMESREAGVNYRTPLGLHHIMARGHHYGPGPWVEGGRPDWTSVYYHRADDGGIGFDRSATGSNAVEQYFPELESQYGNLDTVPERFLLWFHHVPWDYQLHNGRTLWDELALRYQAGVESVRSWRGTWESLAGRVDAERWSHVDSLLMRQEAHAEEWRDACLLYFQQFSGRPLPEGVEEPARELEYYQSIDYPYFPGNP